MDESTRHDFLWGKLRLPLTAITAQEWYELCTYMTKKNEEGEGGTFGFRHTLQYLGNFALLEQQLTFMNGRPSPWLPTNLLEFIASHPSSFPEGIDLKTRCMVVYLNRQLPEYPDGFGNGSIFETIVLVTMKGEWLLANFSYVAPIKCSWIGDAQGVVRLLEVKPFSEYALKQLFETNPVIGLTIFEALRDSVNQGIGNVKSRLKELESAKKFTDQVWDRIDRLSNRR